MANGEKIPSPPVIYESLHVEHSSKWKSLFVTISCLVSHALFFIGQFSDVWSVDLKVDITNVTLVGSLLSPKLEFNITVPETHYAEIVESFTYTGSVERLWNFATENDFIWFQFSKVAWTSQTAAVILALFSGVWPHAKLIALHLLWYTPVIPKRRSRALYWLGFFGKYSMLDVFVVCYLVVLVQLCIDLPASQLAYNLGTGLPGFLDSLNSTTLVHGFCEGLLDAHIIHHIHECLDIGKLLIEDTNVRDRILRDFVENVHETGDVFVRLAAQSQPGIYFYSSGVWLSLVISLVVDIFDDRVRHNGGPDDAEILETPTGSKDSFTEQLQPLLDPVSESRLANSKARTISVGMVVPEVTISHRTISAGVVISEGNEDDLLVIPEAKPGRTTSSSKNIAYDFNRDLLDQEEDFTETTGDGPNLFSPSPLAKENAAERDDSFEILLTRSGYFSLVVLTLLGAAAFATNYGIELRTQHVELPGEIGMILNMMYAAPNHTTYMSNDFSLSYVLNQIEDGTESATNRFLSKDFLIFGFIGPITTLVAAFLLCVLPLKVMHQWTLLQLLKFATGFAAWDVLVIAHLLLLLEMPSLTTGMVTVESNNVGVYFCDLMYNSFQPNVYPCFEETFTFVLPAWLLIPFAAVLQACASWLVVALTERQLASRLKTNEPPPLVPVSPLRY